MRLTCYTVMVCSVDERYCEGGKEGGREGGREGEEEL